MNRAEQVVRGVAQQAGGRIVAVLVSFVSLSVTVNYLSIRDYGVLTTVVAFVGLFEIFIDLGIGTVVVRRASAGKAPLERLVGVGLWMSLLYAWPLYLLAVASAYLIYPDQPEVRVGVAILGVSLILATISSSYLPVFEVKISYGALTMAEIVGRFGSLAAILAVVHFDLGLTAIICAQLVPFAVQFVTVLIASRSHGRFRPQSSRSVAVGLLREALPLAGVLLVAISYLRADAVLLSILSTQEQVGAYGLAYRLASNVSMFGAIAASTLLAPTSTAFGESRAAYHRVVTGSTRMMLLLSLSIAMIGWFFVSPTLHLLAPEDMANLSTPLGQLLLVAVALGTLNALFSGALIAAHLQTRLLMLSVVMLAVNVALNVALIPVWQAMGSAVALVATEGLSTVGVIALMHRYAGWSFPFGYLARLAVPVGATGALMAVLQQWGLIVMVITGPICLYLLLSWLGPLKPREAYAALRASQAENPPPSTPGDLLED
ncbi:MAG TPA: flippase [Actinomycetota bacterium]|nr:flippase [Actinomycetota bacterium]HRY09862.1 flippase [Candidatus Nanopelagicales bacterium]